jgi:hypothetical protein
MASNHTAAAVATVALQLMLSVCAQADLTKGSLIEVHDGDVWTSVTFVRAEKTRILVHFDDGRLEWVAADRLHEADQEDLAKMFPAEAPAPVAPAEATSAPAAPGPAPAQPAGATPIPSTPTPTPPAATPDTPAVTPVAPTPRAGQRGFTEGEQIEFKISNSWTPGHVVQLSLPWLLVSNDPPATPSPFGFQQKTYWIEAWSARVPGSAYDISAWDGHAKEAAPGEIAPADQDNNRPQSTGDPFTFVPVDQRPMDPDSLDNQFDTANADSVQSPGNGGDPNLHIATAVPSSEFAAWRLRQEKNDLDGFCVCLGAVKTAIVSFKSNDPTTVYRINLVSHAMMDSRVIPVAGVTVVGASEDGDSLLTVHGWKRSVQYWKWNKSAYKLITNLRIDEGTEIDSAFLVGADHAVIEEKRGSNQNNEVFLVDLQNKRVLSSIKTEPDSTMYVHPSGQIVGVITVDKTALLLKTSDFSVINEFDDAGAGSNVTVDPSGSLIAYLGTAGSVRILKVADKTQVGQVSVGSQFKGRLDLVDDKFLVVDHRTVYDISSGIPVWIYKTTEGVGGFDHMYLNPLANGQFMLASQAGIFGGRVTAAAVLSIPDAMGRAAVKNAKPDDFLLSPGTPIQVDWDFSAFGADKDKAHQAVVDAVHAAGMAMAPSDKVPFHLTMSIAAGPTEQRDYAPTNRGMIDRVTTVSVTPNILTATLTYQGAAVWSQEIVFQAGATVQSGPNHSFQDDANDQSKPSAGPLKALNLPIFLPKGAKPGSPAALGVSDLGDRRFIPEKPPAS